MKPSFDEMHASADAVREHYLGYRRWLADQPGDVIRSRREEAEVIFRRVGITFAVYGAKDEDGSGTERLIPFDLIPRVIPAREWAELEAGLRQRVTALNRFIHDVYHGQEILEAGIVPREQVLHNAQFRTEMMHVEVPGAVYSHIAGIDIVRAVALSVLRHRVVTNFTAEAEGIKPDRIIADLVAGVAHGGEGLRSVDADQAGAVVGAHQIEVVHGWRRCRGGWLTARSRA